MQGTIVSQSAPVESKITLTLNLLDGSKPPKQETLSIHESLAALFPVGKTITFFNPNYPQPKPADAG
jgi:hypothetical protein